MAAEGAPGFCATVSGDTPPGAPIVLINNSTRDGPWVSESGLLAGWEVELPSKTVGGAFTKRETLSLTSLPHGLAKVMGETEYQEQVVAIRDLTEAHSKSLLRLKVVPLLIGSLLVVLSFVVILGAAIPLFAGLISEDAYLYIAMLGGVIIALVLASLILALGYAHYRTGMAGKTMGYEIAKATAHWEARGIAWRLKTSNPIATMTGGRNPTVIAAYAARVYVECAPNAIELFQTHGSFPVTRSIPSHGIERYADYGSIAEADRSSERFTGGPDGTPKFAIAFSDIFFNKIRHMVPKRPMMLRDVMGANEFAEQVGVINRDLELLSRPWKRRFTVFLVSAMCFLPSVFLGMVPGLLWVAVGGNHYLWIPLGVGVAIMAVPIIGLFGACLPWKTQKRPPT